MKISKNAKIGIGAILVIGLIVAWKKGLFTTKSNVKKEDKKLNVSGNDTMYDKGGRRQSLSSVIEDNG